MYRGLEFSITVFVLSLGTIFDAFFCMDKTIFFLSFVFLIALFSMFWQYLAGFYSSDINPRRNLGVGSIGGCPLTLSFGKAAVACIALFTGVLVRWLVPRSPAFLSRWTTLSTTASDLPAGDPPRLYAIHVFLLLSVLFCIEGPMQVKPARASATGSGTTSAD
jgi:hypothetical protein